MVTMKVIVLYFVSVVSLALFYRIESYASLHQYVRMFNKLSRTGSKSFHLSSSSPNESVFDKRQDAVNQMTIDEIKSELDLRGLNYEECTTKSELVQLLVNSRVKGVADPSIIDQFNQNTKENVNADFNEEIISQATSKDGTLPGGLSPQIVKAMTSDPEIMRLLRDPKMQDVMKAVMTSGPEGLKKYLSDPGMFTYSSFTCCIL
jgi:hypothetical protein